MFASAFIVFRELLEIILALSIILTFLKKTDKTRLNKYVWGGVSFGILLSICLGFIFNILFHGLKGKTEQLFEGTLMLVTTGLITWMILWVHRQKEVALKIKQKLSSHIESGYKLGIFFLAVSVVIREGTETIFYLTASRVIGFYDQFYGTLLGIIAAVLIVFVLYRFSYRVNLTLIFNSTSVFLIFFASSLLSHSIHEFQEAGFLPFFRFNPIFNMSLLELISYPLYLFIIWQLFKITSKKKEV